MEDLTKKIEKNRAALLPAASSTAALLASGEEILIMEDGRIVPA